MRSLKKIFLLIAILIASLVNGYSNIVPGELLVRMHDWVTDEIMDEFISDYSQYELKVKEILSSSLKMYTISYNHRLINHETFLEMIINDERVRIAQFNHLLGPGYIYTHTYPNPAKSYVIFRANTLEDWAIREVTIFNIKGQLVKTLRDSITVWDLKDENGDKVTSGVYFYHIRPQYLSGRFVILR